MFAGTISVIPWFEHLLAFKKYLPSAFLILIPRSIPLISLFKISVPVSLRRAGLGFGKKKDRVTAETGTCLRATQCLPW